MGNSKEALKDVLAYLQSELITDREFVEYAETLEKLITGYIREVDDEKARNVACKIIDRLKEACDDATK